MKVRKKGTETSLYFIFFQHNMKHSFFLDVKLLKALCTKPMLKKVLRLEFI